MPELNNLRVCSWCSGCEGCDDCSTSVDSACGCHAADDEVVVLTLREHDELRGDLAAALEYAKKAVAKASYWYGRAQSAWNDGDKTANDLVKAVFGDDADREEFRQDWARIAALGAPELQHRLIDPDGKPHPATDWDLAHESDWLPGVRHEVRDVYPTAWRAAGPHPSTPIGDEAP